MKMLKVCIWKIKLYIFTKSWNRSRKIAFEKLRQNGVQIAINYSYGTSIGLIKPIFLEVFKYDYSGRIAGISLERYDPEQHGFFNIYGEGHGLLDSCIPKLIQEPILSLVWNLNFLQQEKLLIH